MYKLEVWGGGVTDHTAYMRSEELSCHVTSHSSTDFSVGVGPITSSDSTLYEIVSMWRVCLKKRSHFFISVLLYMSPKACGFNTMVPTSHFSRRLGSCLDNSFPEGGLGVEVRFTRPPVVSFYLCENALK